MRPSEQLHEIAKAWTAQNALNSWEVLPFAKEALQIIHEYPELQNSFEDTFIQILIEGFDQELVEVCVHSLRWPSLKTKVESLHQEAIQRDDMRAVPAFAHVLEAFDPNWLAGEIEDYYPRFFSSYQAT